MPLVARFDTPGSLRDAPAGSALYANWHQRVARLLKDRTAGSGTGEFVDPSVVSLTRGREQAYLWTGFPRPHLVVTHRDDREAAFAAGEDRLAQHEYLEWRVERDAQGRITKVTFVTETPEYWEALAETEPALLLSLYRSLVSPEVARADLFDAGGRYVRDNVWNHARGIVHYVMKINGLAPLINAEQDTPLRAGVADNYAAMPLTFASGKPLLTSADARFSLDIGVLQRQGLSLTVGSPVGLYMVELDTTGFARPDGSPVGDYWTVVRGSAGAALRAEYAVPASEGFVVSDIRIGGRAIRYGGQLAEHVTVMAGGFAGTRS
jgi:hypothetical protein